MAIKLVFCCRRKPGMSRAEFQQYWLESHGPLVRSLRAALPQMRRYVQSHTLDSPANDAIRAGRGSGEAFDGITEVWFDSLASMGASSTEEAAAAGRRLFEDESRFIDFAASSVFVTEEHEIF
jgi:uncharacterized protein (TIGR02118 family)